ncbi:galactoside permease [Piscirickettsia salmonis]|uniref:MFS transporter n=2 Tax=Piscirickettsia salmonis TaxID=1238 RepID=UPI001E47978C|nr:MFS transporter [Piscirickettsia salmonis]QGP55823.1 galactoside permease [Piscirickettsia salmonis]QGP58309.1 galactoside permease [Piscirickettsia salmonis]QGP65392.1 galactoside permease [Piscirickettsia salmonis]
MLKAMDKMMAPYFGLPRDIYIIALTEFVLALGRFVFPFLSLLLTQKLGLTIAQAGVWIAATGLNSLLGSLIGGKLSDHCRRRSIIIVGQACSVMVMFIGGFCATRLVTASFTMGMAMPAVRALLTDLSTPDNRDAVMSFSYLVFNLGFGAGLLLAGFLFTHYTHWLFWLDALTAFVSLLLIIFYLTEEHTVEANSHLEQAVAGSVWLVLKRRPQLVSYTLICTVLSLTMAQLIFAFPLYLAALFNAQGAQYYGQIMTANAVIVVIFTPILTVLTRRYSALIGTMIAAIFLGLCYSTLLLNQSLIVIFLAVFFMTVAEVLIVTKSSVFIANHSPSSHRGRITGILPAVISSANYFSPVMMGGYIDRFGFHALWYLMIILAVLGVCSLGLMLLSELKHSHLYS